MRSGYRSSPSAPAQPIVYLHEENRPLSAIAADLPLLAQIGPGDGVGFHVIAAPAALEVLLDRERDFQLLKVGCMFGYTA